MSADSRGKWSRHHSGGGHTPTNQASASATDPSAQRPAFLRFASAMALDRSRLRRRLQEALGDEFTVGALLGEGGFAAVFKAREKPLRPDVAAKVVDLGLTPSPSLAQRFVREARTLARPDHPHIVPLYKPRASPT